MKYYLIAGEASGDLHGANLMKALRELDPEAQFRYWGGDRMMEQSPGLVTHYRDIAFMGFVEVLLNISKILKALDTCKGDVLEFAPDALILIDYPGFNLRIAKWAHQQGIDVHYYISPQVWAWKSHRAKQIAIWSKKLYVILPFEEKFYSDRGFEAMFVGHPLLDAIASYDDQSASAHQKSRKPVVALLPGSRKQEVRIMLPIMLLASRHFPDCQFVIAGVSSLPEAMYASLMVEDPTVSIEIDKTYDLLSRADFALVTSGTATLEAALFNVPQVVCYRGGVLNYLIARQVVNVPYISLVNLIMDQPLVVELVQHDLTIDRLRRELSKLMESDERNRVLLGYAQLKEILGNAGTSERVAQSIITSSSPLS